MKLFGIKCVLLSYTCEFYLSHDRTGLAPRRGRSCVKSKGVIRVRKPPKKPATIARIMKAIRGSISDVLVWRTPSGIDQKFCGYHCLDQYVGSRLTAKGWQQVRPEQPEPDDCCAQCGCRLHVPTQL